MIRRRGATFEPDALEPYRYHPVQSRLWWDDVRFKIVSAGRRSGKTDLARRCVYTRSFEAKKWHDPRYFLAGPTLPQSRRIFWDWIKARYPSRWVVDVSETFLRIQLLWGAEIWVVSLDEPARIEGVPWDGGVVTEFGNVKATTWEENIRPAFAERDGWAWIEGVPEGLNHYYDRWQASAKWPDWGRYTWHTADIQPASEVEAARREMDPRTFRQEYEASFEAHSGRVYYAFERDRDVHEFEPPANLGTEDCPWRVGFDFNVHPMSAAAGWQDDETGQVYVWRVYQLPSSNTDELGRRVMDDLGLAALGRRAVAPIAYPDPSGKSRHTSAPVGTSDHSILRALGFEVRARTAAPTVRNRINAVNTRFATGDGRRRAHIHPRCQPLVRAFDGLVYKAHTNEPDKTSRHDHITDAAGYWWEFEFPVHGGEIEQAKF